MQIHIEQDGESEHWQPEILDNPNLDASFGYEIVIVKVPGPSGKWRDRIKDWFLPSEPISISQVLPLEQAINGATRLHYMKIKHRSPMDTEVCVRLFDPSN